MLYIHHQQCGAKSQMSSICLLWHMAVAHARLLTWQLQVASNRRYLLGNSQEVEKHDGDSQTKFYLCLLSSTLKYFKSEVLFWQIWGRMRLCFLQIVKDLMEWKMKNLFCDLHYFFSLWANKGMGVQWFGHWWFYNFKEVCKNKK